MSKETTTRLPPRNLSSTPRKWQPQCSLNLTWARLKCFSRRNRAMAKNIIDCRWVIKWKHEVAATSVADASKQSGAITVSKRVIRCRLTVRGFKDRDAQNLDSCAGTSQRYSQRLVCSEAARRGWPICATDISKAFLQGVTYEELSSLTGEPIREVNFYLPGKSTFTSQGTVFQS